MCGASFFMRIFLVEVFAKVKVNLDLLKGKIAGKRANLRARNVLLIAYSGYVIWTPALISSSLHLRRSIIRT
jgi:hypothetical protein